MTVEQIRELRVECNGRISDNSMWLSMFGHDEKRASDLADAEAKLKKLQEHCTHSSEIGGLCPDCGRLGEGVSVALQLEHYKLKLSDAQKWLDILDARDAAAAES